MKNVRLFTSSVLRMARPDGGPLSPGLNVRNSVTPVQFE
jgi:hypothetical protein